MRTLARLRGNPSTRLKAMATMILAGAIATTAWGCATQDAKTATMSIAAGVLMLAWVALAIRLDRLTSITAARTTRYAMAAAATC